jgi:hypothetical protein
VSGASQCWWLAGLWLFNAACEIWFGLL